MSTQNDHNERTLLREWQQKASKRRTLHLEAYYHYSRINTAMGITIIILSALTGGTGLGTFHLENVPIAVIIGIVNLVTAILSSVQHFCKFATKSHLNEKVSIEFSNLSRHIEAILIKHQITHDDVDHICTQYNTIMNDEAVLPRSLIRQNLAIKMTRVSTI